MLLGSKGLVKRTQVSCFRRLIVSHARWAGTLPCWKVKNLLPISRMTGSDFWVRSTSRLYASIDFHSSIDKKVYSGPFVPTWTHPWTQYRLGEGRACLQQTLWCNLSLSCRSHCTDAIFRDFWVWLHKPEIVIMVADWIVITFKHRILILGGVCKICNRKWFNFKF